VVAGRALRPLREITAAAQEISGEPARRLGSAVRTMSCAGLQTFDACSNGSTGVQCTAPVRANVSHELRTPLTYERTLIEVALADRTPTRTSCERYASSAALRRAEQRLIDALLDLSADSAASRRASR